ncbi:hypothetical protein FSP39_022158 [Pinctada imbricata]|uniref:AIP/AIPL N-terminal FKBP-type PPIase domain-containing protein n=1 Tax=Pinctada imbricata TaxID=66713 RepID=A0AA89BWB6_PINIB|nr:hypothetical protein FSP39_022158 [Pinctada imbricata]
MCNEDKTVLDDSRNHTKPMELILGKKFKLEVWEECISTMRVGEISSFTCDTKHVTSYPVVSKSLREIFGKKSEHSHNHASHTEGHHCCGMMSFAEQGVGHDDLNVLIKNPQPLTFTMELLRVERPGEYEKESWVMTEDEKKNKIPQLKEEGNRLFKEKKYAEAAEKYSEALGYLEQFILKEKPGDTEWNALEDSKTPFLLNFCQCKLFLKDFYPVIEHTTHVLTRDPDNVKALFRRAKAHVGAWNVSEARQDFVRTAELDTSLANAVSKELRHLEELEKEKNAQDREKLKGLFS